MNGGETKREKQRGQSGREELLERMSLALPNDGAVETLDGLFLARLTEPMESKLALYEPALCFVVQGGKQVLVGEEVLRYDPGNYLLFTVDLPVVFKVEEASKDKPYFGPEAEPRLDTRHRGHDGSRRRNQEGRRQH